MKKKLIAALVVISAFAGGYYIAHNDCSCGAACACSTCTCPIK